MNKLFAVFNKEWKINLLLVVFTFCIYFFYFHEAILNLNSLLSSITGDSIKNYYTYVYHTIYDPDFLHFAGMNYPYGEHVCFTDNHPAITFVLRFLPFTHNYLIGILHALIFLSCILSPIVISKLFGRLGVDRISAFFISVGVILLSPQFFRLYAGHYAMIYQFMIPLCALLIVDYFKAKTHKNALRLFLYNLFIFFIHAYPAFGLCVFTLLSMLIFELLKFDKHSFLKNMLSIFNAAILPMLLFRLFLLATDHHIDRPTEPHGVEVSVTIPGSILVPVAGPFQHFMESVFRTKPGEFEGYCYLGIALIVLTFISLLTLPFFYKKIKCNKEILVLFIASLLLLLFALGYHNYLLRLMHINSATLNQFRALGRYAWFFYYMLPVFIFSTIYLSLKDRISTGLFHAGFTSLAFVFFIFNLVEEGALFRDYEPIYFKDRNFFNEKFLNAEEKQIIKSIHSKKPQAILSLPNFNVGTDMYERCSDDLSYHFTFIYSFHTGVPIASAKMSRNSIPETEKVIELLNVYKKNRAAISLMNDRPLLIMKSKPWYPDEDRIWSQAQPFHHNDSIQFAYAPATILTTPVIDKKVVTIKKPVVEINDSSNIAYIRRLNRAPFILSYSGEYNLVYKLDSNTVVPGHYIVSLHYYYKNTSWRDMQCHLLVTTRKNGIYNWAHFFSMKELSGFYNGYGVFEYKLDLEKETNYEFVMIRAGDLYYKISDFMLRPEGTTIKVITAKDTVYNNFPAY